MARTKTEERLMNARERLTGEGEEGLQAWFRREIEDRRGSAPAKSTVHRYVTEEADMDDRSDLTLRELEEEAEEAGPWEPIEVAELPNLGHERERNALLIADWIREEPGTLRSLGKKYSISAARAGQIVEQADVRRLSEIRGG